MKGDVIVIRYEGPKGSPGMPEMLAPGSALVGAGLGKYVALVTDGRFRPELKKTLKKILSNRCLLMPLRLFEAEPC